MSEAAGFSTSETQKCLQIASFAAIRPRTTTRANSLRNRRSGVRISPGALQESPANRDVHDPAQVLVEAIRGPKMAQTFSASRRMSDPVRIVAVVRVGREREIHAKALPPARVLAALAIAGKVDGMGPCGSTREHKGALRWRAERLTAPTPIGALASGRTHQSGAAIDDCRFEWCIPHAAFAGGLGPGA